MWLAAIGSQHVDAYVSATSEACYILLASTMFPALTAG